MGSLGRDEFTKLKEHDFYEVGRQLAKQGSWGPQWWLGGPLEPACRWPKPLGLGSML